MVLHRRECCGVNSLMKPSEDVPIALPHTEHGRHPTPRVTHRTRSSVRATQQRVHSTGRADTRHTAPVAQRRTLQGRRSQTTCRL
jgi:hypothetical protein